MIYAHCFVNRENLWTAKCFKAKKKTIFLQIVCVLTFSLLCYMLLYIETGEHVRHTENQSTAGTDIDIEYFLL